MNSTKTVIGGLGVAVISVIVGALASRAFAYPEVTRADFRAMSKDIEETRADLKDFKSDFRDMLRKIEVLQTQFNDHRGGDQHQDQETKNNNIYRITNQEIDKALFRFSSELKSLIVATITEKIRIPPQWMTDKVEDIEARQRVIEKSFDSLASKLERIERLLRTHDTGTGD